jgi:hypothetical protein
MRFHLLETHAFCGVTVQDFADKVGYLGAEVEGKFDVDLEDLVVSLVLIHFAFERSSACAEFVAEDTKTPDISSFVVEISSDDFGRNVVKRAAKRLALAG